MRSGKPEPSIKWFKEGKQLTDSADFEITYQNGRVKLVIPEVFKEDSGKYICSAQNKAGQAQSTAELVVKGEILYFSVSRSLYIHVLLGLIMTTRGRDLTCGPATM